MKKFIALLFCLILGVQVACAEKLPPKDSYLANPEDYPVLFGYLNNYADLLFENFNPGILEAYNWGPIAFYTINKNGTIENYSFSSRQIEKVVINTPPPPFPQNLEADKIKVHLVLMKAKQPKIHVDYWQSHPYAYISLDKDHIPKQWFKKKTKK